MKFDLHLLNLSTNFLAPLTSFNVFSGTLIVLDILFGVPCCPQKKKLERKPFQHPSMSFLECFTMVSNAFHALRKDKTQNIFDLSAPNVLYILLGAPSILQYHIGHTQCPLVPPITQKEKILCNLTPFLTLIYQGHSNLGCLIRWHPILVCPFRTLACQSSSWTIIWAVQKFKKLWKC